MKTREPAIYCWRLGRVEGYEDAGNAIPGMPD